MTEAFLSELGRHIQVVLIFVYLLLAMLFMANRATWPVALYYVGCFVKDSGVYVLAFLMR